MNFPLEQVGNTVTYLIKFASWFPHHTGRLRDNATSGHMHFDNVYRIHFSSAVAPYVQDLEEGTSPHDIPNAFGYITPGKKTKSGKRISIPNFGIGGRFDGKFHPGSMKHKGFISQKAVGAIVDYIAARYEGVVVEV